VRAAAITNALFVLALPLTYIAAVGAVVHASPRPRQTLLHAATLTVSVVAALALLEGAAAARLVHWELVFRGLTGEQQHYVPDPDLGFRHTPNARASTRPRGDLETAWGLPASRPDRVTVTYDRRGYRNAAELTRAPIVLIGDSYVEGDYASDDQIVSKRLQDRMGEPVANLGVAGYGTAQELAVLTLDAMSLQPRVVIWFFFEGNDLYDDQAFDNALLVPRETRVSGWADGHGWWRRSLVRNGLGPLRLMLAPLVPGYCPHVGILTVGPYRGQPVLFASPGRSSSAADGNGPSTRSEKVCGSFASAMSICCWSTSPSSSACIGTSSRSRRTASSASGRSGRFPNCSSNSAAATG
jgi:hypothetical protein